MAEQRQPRRILLVQTRHIGDVVVSTALLELLHAAHPQATIDWLAEPHTAPLLERHPLIGRVFILPSGRVLQTARSIRAQRYDWVIDAQGTWRAAMVTLLSRAPVRIGWSGVTRGWGYTRRVARAGRDSDVYVVRDRARLLAALGVPVRDSAPRLVLGDDERSWAAGVVAELTGDRPRVGVLISTRFAWKDWAPEKFAEVAKALAAEGVATVVFRAPGAESQEERFARAAGDSAAFAPAVPIRQLMALIASCDVFVSGDTGPAHIATALGVPRVTIFGPTPAAGWTPDSTAAVAVRDGAARCAACAGQAPADAHTCLDTVTPSMVLGPLRELLRARGGNEIAPEASPSGVRPGER